MYKALSPTYLVKDPYSYYFTIKIPKDLLTTISRKELRYSLKTGNLSRAKAMARLLAGQIQLLFRKIRRGMNLTNEQILHMIKNYRDKLFQEYNQPLMYCQDTESWPEDQTKIEVQYLDGKIRYSKEKANLCDYSEVKAVVDKLLDDNEISKTEIDKKSVKYSKLCSGILRSQIDSDEHDLKRLATGKFSDDIENVFKEGLPGSPALPQDPKQEPVKPSKTISKVMALFTGARLNEIEQLYLSDFQQYEGVWCINTNNNTEDKRIKNLASKRFIPLYPFFVEDLGIIERVRS